jgi:hypothetical protein
MSNTIIKLENISKQYRLGQVGTQTLRGDLQRWWHTLRGKEDPTLKIGQTNQLNVTQKTASRADTVSLSNCSAAITGNSKQ